MESGFNSAPASLSLMPQASRRLRRAVQWLPVLSLLLVGTAPYLVSLRAPFVMDDFHQIVENPLIRDLDYFVEPRRTEAAGANEHQLAGFRTRPVVLLTFALNYRVHGLEPLGYHVVNLAIHLLAGLLLYRLVSRTLRLPCFGGSRLRGREPLLAWFAAVLFLLHPVQTQAVTYVVQRMASLAGLFCLLALVAYIEARLARRRSLRWLSYLLSVLALVAAMYSKQSAATFPLLILVYEFLFFDAPLRKRFASLLPHLATIAIVPVSMLRSGVAAAGLLDAVAQSARADSELSRLEYVLTQFRVIVTYLRLLIWPANQNLDYDYPVYRSLGELPVVLSLLLLLGLGALAVFSIARSRHGEPAWRLVGFGVLWFFVALAVESSFIPIADVIFEHRLYLPSAGVLTATLVALWLLVPRRRAPVLIGGVALVLLTLAIATHRRNHTWSSMIALWGDTAAKSPGKARVHYSLGGSYFLAGNLEAASQEWETAVRLDPNHSWSLNSLGALALQRQEVAEANRYFQRSVVADGSNTEAHFNLATTATALGRENEAITHFRVFLSLTPDKGSPLAVRARSQIHRLATEAAQRGDLDLVAQAIWRFDELAAIPPADPSLLSIYDEVRHRIYMATADSALARLRMASFLTRAGAPAQAIAEARSALSLAPNSIELSNRVANLFSQNGAAAEAVSLLRAAIDKRPNDSILHNSLGIALRAAGDLVAAEAEYLRALAIEPNYGEAHHNLGNVYRDQGRLDLAIAEFKTASQLLPGNPVIEQNLLALQAQRTSKDR